MWSCNTAGMNTLVILKELPYKSLCHTSPADLKPRIAQFPSWSPWYCCGWGRWKATNSARVNVGFFPPWEVCLVDGEAASCIQLYPKLAILRLVSFDQKFIVSRCFQMMFQMLSHPSSLLNLYEFVEGLLVLLQLCRKSLLSGEMDHWWGHGFCPRFWV